MEWASGLFWGHGVDASEEEGALFLFIERMIRRMRYMSVVAKSCLFCMWRPYSGIKFFTHCWLIKLRAPGNIVNAGFTDVSLCSRQTWHKALIFICTAHIECRGTCNGTASVRSVRLSHLSLLQQRAVGLLLGAPPAGDIE